MIEGDGVIEFMGIKMHAWTMSKTVAEIRTRISYGLFTQHVVVNVAKIVNMGRDSKLLNSVESCDIINIDGMGVVWGASFLGCNIPERVAGVDLFHNLLEMAGVEKYPVYLLGAKQDVLEKAVENIEKDFPQLEIAGYHHGYFWDDEQKVVEDISRSGARLLFVAISSPKKENFISHWREKLGVDFVMGVGGTFDVVAGKSKRAPVFMQKAGLEWFHRLLQEPRRMWKRYLFTNTVFAVKLLRFKFLGF
jgi:N-acetylglucosaminyldiphosphoundecaprenol N-acetyl-beta-D-mannosaminyltransferase